MLEMRQPMPHAHRWRHAQPLQRGLLEGHHIARSRRVAQRVDLQVHQRAAGVAHRLVPLSPAPCRLQTVDQRLRDGLARLPVAGMAAQHLGLAQPVLEQLRRQLHEVAQHLGAGQPVVGDVGQQAVQAMAELVEQRARIVEGQQRGLPRRRLGKVVVVDDDGPVHPAVARLVGEVAHPGARALGRTGKVVLQEQAGAAPLGVEHLVDLHVRVVGAHIRPRLEAHAEEALGAVEQGLDHALQREIGLHLGIVDVVAGLAHLLRPVAPIPGFGLALHAMAAHHRDQGLALPLGRRQRALPDLAQQLAHRLLATGHAVGQHVVGVVVEAVLARLGIAQHQDALDQRPVVGFTRHLAAPAPGPPGLLAQVAPVGVGQKGFDQRAVQGDDMRRLVQAAFGRRLPGCGPHEIRQAGQIGLAAQHQLISSLVSQHVLGELGAQRGQLLHDGRITLLGLRPQAGPGPHAVQVQALQQAQGLGLQAQAVALGMQCVQTGKHPGVHLHRAVMRSQRRRQLTLHGLQGRRGGRGRQVRQQRVEPVEPGARTVQRRHGVVEAGRGHLGPDGIQLQALFGHGRLQGDGEMLRADVVERGQPEGRGPGGQQGVVLGVHRSLFWSKASHGETVTP